MWTPHSRWGKASSVPAQLLFPMLVVREVMLVDLVCVVHDGRETPHDLLRFGRANRQNGPLSAHVAKQKKRKGDWATHAAQTKLEAIKPYSVVSASVGLLAPMTKNSPSGPPDPRLRLDTVKSAFTLSQISVLNFVISSGVKRPVP